MPKVAEDAGVDRQVVFMVLAPDGEPSFASVASTLKTIGLPLSAAA
jgi:DNA-binding phage protein